MNNRELAGLKFGKLLVIRRYSEKGVNPVKWVCRCDCGREKPIAIHAVISGRIKSCGCLKSEAARKRWSRNLSGKTFGDWTVLHEAERSKIYPHNVMWHCLCKCGAERDVPSSALLSKGSKGCGCARKLDGNEAAKHKLFSCYRRGARSRGLPFELSLDQLIKLASQSCFYCGSDPKSVMRTYKKKYATQEAIFLYNGIDRQNPKEGYTSSNSVPCCARCNTAKWELSVEQFRTWIKQAYIHLYRKISDKTPGQLMDQLCTANIKCFYAQEKLMQSKTAEEKAKWAQEAQETNALRCRLMRSIDAILDFNEDMVTNKTYCQQPILGLEPVP